LILLNKSRRIELDRKRTLAELIEDKKAVIFDFDNILVDSEPYHYKAYNIVFSKRGHTLDRDEYWLEWTSKGGGAEGEIARHNLLMDPDDIRSEKDPIYSEFCRTSITMFPDAKEIVEAFHRAGYTLSIASGSYERDIRTIIVKNGIESYFSAVVGKDGIQRTKPHPETFLKACSLIEIPPSDCLAIEDAEKGVRAAKEAGMDVIVIETELTRGFDFSGTDLVLPDLGGLRAALDEILSGP
jgi:beta-phosphoglucomutase-like phosphatase (HAD superfamily)